jgi:signal transduction histidine kinase
MAVQDPYGLLRRAVRIANDSALAYPARLRSLASLVAATFRLASANIYLIDNERQHLILNIASDGPSQFATSRIPLGEGIAGRCGLNRATVQDGRDMLHQAETVKETVHTVIAMPIGACGVLSLGVMGECPGKKEMAILEDILPAISGVIQRVIISEASRRKVRTLTALGEIGQMLNKPIPPRNLAALVLQASQKHTGSCCTTLRLLEGNGLPAGVFRKYRRETRSWQSELAEIEESTSTRAIASGETIRVHDLHDRMAASLPPSLICVPLRFESRVLGTISFFGSRGDHGHFRPFDDDDRMFCENIATLASNALSGAANYRQIVRLSAANDKKLRELILLYRLSNTMLSTTSINKLMHLTLTALTAGNISFFERAMLFLVNERTNTIQGMLGAIHNISEGIIKPVEDRNDPLTGRWDITEDDMARQSDAEISRRVKESRIPLDRSRNITSRAILDRKLIHVGDVSQEPLIDRDFVKRFGISSFAVAPLVAKKRVVGIVLVDNPLSSRPISRDDLRILKLMANQAGIAIENAMLYTEIKDTSRTLSEAQERLIQGERLAAIGEMAAGLAHELKGPLVSIGGFARRLEQKLAGNSSDHESAHIIVREVQRLEAMLTDILSFSRKTTICYEACSIDAIVNESLTLAAERMAHHGIKLKRRIEPDIPTILGDSPQLKQVFLNLFLNAVEAMRQGGTLQVKVEPTSMGNTPAVAVIVSDTGGGIPLKMLHSIFSPFFTTKESGTGLGLPIVHKIVTQHGGKIDVCNRDEGAEFRVVLPEHP